MPRPPLMSRLAPCLAMLILVLNDHMLKGSGLLPGLITGKLSDLAGLFFFPILLVALSRRLLPPALACALTGLCFAALKLDPATNALAARLWGPNVMDPADLIALVMLLPAWWLMRRPVTATPRRALERGAILIAAAASVATSAQPPPVFDQPRQYPVWQLAGSQDSMLVGCVHTRIWIARSVKQGLGLGVRAENRCSAPVQLDTLGELVLGQDVRMSQPDRHELKHQRWSLEPGQLERRYIPIPFDNQRAWNEGRDVAVLSLAWSLTPQQGQQIEPAHLNQNVLLRQLRAADHRVRQLLPSVAP